MGTSRWHSLVIARKLRIIFFADSYYAGGMQIIAARMGDRAKSTARVFLHAFRLGEEMIG